ncbi:MAG: leucine-rich repeat protein [Oscillospiraceae bacterium]
MKRNSKIVIAGIASLALVFCAGGYIPTVGIRPTSSLNLTAYAGDVTATFTIDDVVYQVLGVDVTTKARVVGYTGNGSEIVIPSEIAHNYTNSAGEEVTETITVTEIGESAFNDNIKIKKVTLPDTLETIRFWAFGRCSNLESINFPEGLTFIGNDAFNSTRLTSVALPASLETIDEWAFNNCTRLKTVSFAENSKLATISGGAFNSCTALTSFDMPSSVTTIDSRAFKDDTKLTAITLPEGLNSLDEYAFMNSGLKTITLPSTLKKFGSGVFQDSTSLTEAVFPDSMAVIPQETFRNCTSLKTVNFPSVLTSIGNAAFENTSISEELSLRDDFEYLGGAAFNGSNMDIKLTLNSDIKIGGNVGNGITEVVFDGNITIIPDGLCGENDRLKKVTFAGGDVRTIGAHAFQGTGSLRTVVLSDSIIEIQHDAFASSGITTLEMGNGVETIGYNAFKDSGLKTATFSKNLQTIEDAAFNNCQLTGDIVLPDSLETIGTNAFDGTKISTLKTGKNLRKIGDGAFANCGYLYKLTLNEGLETIGSSAFGGTVLAGKLVIPEGVTTIGTSAFRSLKISGLTLPSTIETIGGLAFCDMGADIETLVIPEGCKTLGEAAFWGCGIKHLTLPDSLEYIGKNCFGNFTYDGYAREGDNAIEGTVTVAAKFIGENAFIGNNITELILKDGVETIESGAFCGLPIKKLYLPDSIKSIQGTINSLWAWPAFSNCHELEEIEHFPAQLEELGEGAFMNSESLKKIAPLPSTLTTIPASLFQNCNSLTGTLELNEGIRIIDNDAFNGCKFTGVNLPNSLTMIRDSAFSDNRINYLDLNNVTYIGAGAFGNNIDYRFDETDTKHYATNVNKRFIVIPETVEFIGDGAFGFFGYTIGDDTTTGASYRGAIDGFIVKGCTDIAKKYAESIDHGVQVWSGGQGSYTSAENYFNYEEIQRSEGDCNLDGECNVLDVIILTKYLHGKAHLADWEAVDYNKDGKINVIDLSLLKKALLKK